MGIFRRGKNSDAADQQDDLGVDDSTQDGAVPDPDATAVAPEGGSGEPDPVVERVEGQGPFDSAEVPQDDERLDLGALRIQGVAGMELRLELDEGTGQVVGATAVLGDSAVQLQAFAAPRSSGIWADIRSEIAESILTQGGTADESAGPLGIELRTRMPSAGPDGRTVFAPARFMGVDGPRWFLRAVFSGRAAIDDEAAEPLLEVVRSVVVVRGESAMAPREMLTLQLPEQPAAPQEAGDGDQGGTPAVDDLKPFERGPEITEIR